jgi:hypothetical protein
MSRKSGNRFSDKDMRKQEKLERIPIRPNRDALWRARNGRVASCIWSDCETLA